MSPVRPAAVAGMFYPGAPAALTADVREYLDDAAPRSPQGALPPKAVIVPHAGYVYSGPVAAFAYARIALGFDTIRRVVLFGPAHRVPVRGKSVV